jgi:asparagine synthase (glutamine-hydrolysing)
MCGFVGAFVYGSYLDAHRGALETGLATIRHRGPDATNQLTVDSVYLGQNRLSIIDLSDAANQPLKDAREDAWIVYNGEIYNYQALRSAARGPFLTSGDTEVLLRGYLDAGPQFFRQVRGIYAFAIVDKRTRTQVVLGRDPAGVKPLYWFRNARLLAFASEIKALIPLVGSELSVDEDVLKAYLNLGYCPEPRTIYRQIHALTPGHVLVVTADEVREVPVVRYDFTRENTLSFAENAERTQSLIDHAVRRNLVADVDVAVALSGGIDSSLIYASARRHDPDIQGLTVRFAEAGYDESNMARVFADHVAGKQQMVDIEADFNLEQLDRIFLHFDQPYADSSAIPTYYLTRATRQHTKVLLGGDGGDELYNGYLSQRLLPYLRKLRDWPAGDTLMAGVLGVSRLAGAGARRISHRAQALAENPAADMMFDWHSWLPRNTVYNGRSPFLYDGDAGLAMYQQIFVEDQPPGFEQCVAFEHFTRTLLSDYLRKTDMMSMMNGVEYRVPLLDEDLASFALTIPYAQKSSVRQSKKILRHIHARTYPRATSRAPKRGFAIPLDKYLKVEDLMRIREILMRRGGLAKNYIREEYISYLLDAALGFHDASAHVSRAGVYQRMLILYSLELWHTHSAAS